MMTEALAAKRALFNRLSSLTGPGLPLAGLQVAYAWPGRVAEQQCVYGGGIRFTRASAGHDGHAELWLETAQVGVYVRVATPGAEVVDTDARVQEIAAVIETVLAEQPELTGGFTYTGISGGSADYAADDTGPTSILAYQVQVQYYLD
jgi:hypothetical protein